MNQRIVPNAATSQQVERINSIADILLYATTILSISLSLLEHYQFLLDLKNLFTVVNILFVCLYVFLDNRANYIFTKAEMNRRLDWLDNSFGTNFTGKKSAGYFTNDHLSPGFYKLAVNCFENSYHTQFIIAKMQVKIIIQTIIIVLLFVVSASIGNKEIIRLFFELSLPVVLIQKLIKVTIFTSRLENIHDRLKLLFNDLIKTGFDNKTAEALRDIMEYETALAWASLPLSSKVFFKYKEKLATDWEGYKKDYNIKVD